ASFTVASRVRPGAGSRPASLFTRPTCATRGCAVKFTTSCAGPSATPSSPQPLSSGVDMARVSLVVHGRGRGHASRALACARALTDAGHALHVFASGDAGPVLSAQDSARFTAIPIVRPGLGAPGGWLRRLTSDAARFADA